MTRCATPLPDRTPRADPRKGSDCPRACFPAFTLIEMLTTVALLVIVLGLMVSLARDVRNRSSDRVTKDMLIKLDRMMARYIDRNAGALPAVAPLLAEPMPTATAPTVTAPTTTAPTATPPVSSTPADAPAAQTAPAESVLKPAALLNNAQLARALRAQADPGDLAPSFFDAWGSPVVFMPRHHPAIGMAGGDRFFFFSAGPDGRFLTREDNLYSYEIGSE